MNNFLRSATAIWLLMAATGLAQSAASAPTPAPIQTEATSGVPVPADFVIGPEDVIGVVFWRDPDMTGDVTVRPDGIVTLPLIGDMKAAGLRPDALRVQIQEASNKYLADANVTVVVRQVNSRKVFITGEVVTPGAYPLIGPRTVMQLIALAGGLTEYADAKNITIVREEKGQTKSFRFNYRDVARGRSLEQNIALQVGDTVVVP